MVEDKDIVMQIKVALVIVGQSQLLLLYYNVALEIQRVSYSISDTRL